EAQQVAIPGRSTDLLQTLAELLKRHVPPVCWTNLDRGTTTKRSGARGWHGLEIVVTTELTCWAVLDGTSQRRRLIGVVPDVDPEQSAAKLLAFSGKKLQGLGGCDTSYHPADRPDHTRRVAGRNGASWRDIGENTAKTGRFAWSYIHRDAVTADSRTVNPGFLLLDANIVDQVARLEIVAAVHDKVDVGQQALRVVPVEVHGLWLD